MSPSGTGERPRFARIELAGAEKPLWAKDTALRTLEAFPVRLVAA